MYRLISILLVVIGICILCSVISFFMGSRRRRLTAEALIGSAEQEAKRILNEAIRKAESSSKEVILASKEESMKIKIEFEKELKEIRTDIQQQEKRLVQREESIEKRVDSYEKKTEILRKKQEEVEEKKIELSNNLIKKNKELERISGLTVEEAKQNLLETIKNEIKIETAHMIKNITTKAKNDYDNRAKDIITLAIQRCAIDHVTETTVSVVHLPNDEMKGRIIGREGRNIRALEALTGIDFIIDDTPEAVILSGFDAMRRDIARLTLEKLVIDGRIHPARIEEMVIKSREEIEEAIRQEGEAATFEVGVHGIHPDLVRLLGKMKYRTSYGQNQLKHSLEVSHLCGLMAGELGFDVTLAKRAGLLHDIGKSIDQEQEGSHPHIGGALCRKYKENSIVINSAESHHGDVDVISPISILVSAADAISASRIGARREVLESYIKRLEKLEDIADSYPGVEKSFAIQAGRELRVIVVPEKADDVEMTIMARDICNQIENELQYPGQIKVSLIRETRAVEYAK